MIDHVVMLGLSPEADRAELAVVLDGLSALVGKIDGFEDFVFGRNLDLEGKSPGFPAGFICSFRDRAALERYAADDRHGALGARLVALCGNDPDKIMVYDLDRGMQ